MKSIAQDLDVSQPELTRLVRSLRTKGLAVVERQGMSNSVSISDQKHASRLRRVLNEFSHMRLERILSLTSLDVLSALAASPGSSRSDVMSSSDVSARSLHTALKNLRELGVVRARTRGAYEISDRFEPFVEFVREFDDYANQRKAKEFCRDAMVIWQRGHEFIMRTECERESNEFRLTAFSVFEQYGVPLFVGWRYYYHPVGKWRRTINEVLLQSMLLRPRDARENTAILMLWHKSNLSRDLDRLREGASRYGLQDELQAIADYFRDPERNRPPGFPKIGEMEEKLRSVTR
jgi:DNA-binding MarR family transcriptional regulator